MGTGILAVPSTPLADNGLLARLHRESEEAVAACLASAQTEAQKLRETAKGNAETQRSDALTARSQQYAEACRAAREQAEARVRAEFLNAREEAINRVLSAAELQTENLASHPSFPAMLSADIVEALHYMPDGPVTIWCPATIAAIVRSAAARIDDARLTVCVDADLDMGIIARSGDNLIEVDATMVRRLVAGRARLAMRAAHLLGELVA